MPSSQSQHQPSAASLWTHPRSRGLARRCLLSPFVQGVADGSLPQELFEQYVAQDAFFLGSFQKAYVAGRKTSSLLPDGQGGMMVAQFDGLVAGVEEELKMHAKYAAELGIDLSKTTPLSTTTDYTGFLDEIAGSVLSATSASQSQEAAVWLHTLLAAMVPCMRLYAWLGSTLASSGAREKAGRYTRWVEEYSSAPFQDLARQVERLLDAAASMANSHAGDRGPDLARSRYVRAMELELAFFMACSTGPDCTVRTRRDMLAAGALVPPRVLIVAGSDSGGGAGLQADMKACTAMGAFSTSALAALTAQNTEGVHGVMPVPVDFVVQQMQVVLDDIGTDIIKTGMLATAPVAAAVAQQIVRARHKSAESGRSAPMVVVDPVMVSTSGHKLLEDDAITTYTQELIPLATVVTPNIPEAALLLGKRAEDIVGVEAMHKAALELLKLGPEWVLLKGGHDEAGGGDESIDVLVGRPQAEGTAVAAAWRVEDGVTCRVEADGTLWLHAKRMVTRHTHGTGCTLGSAIAAGLAKGLDVRAAVAEAKGYVHGAIAASAGLVLGKGAQGPLNHMWMDEDVQW